MAESDTVGGPCTACGGRGWFVALKVPQVPVIQCAHCQRLPIIECPYCKRFRAPRHAAEEIRRWATLGFVEAQRLKKQRAYLFRRSRIDELCEGRSLDELERLLEKSDGKAGGKRRAGERENAAG